jgi:ribosomal protein S18 acetylase RimI-like enzyme
MEYNMDSVQYLKPDHPELHKIIELAIGFPTPEKVQDVLASYSQVNHYLLGREIDGHIVGIIGFELANEIANIKHLAVAKGYRKLGIGRELINAMINRIDANEIQAQTDKEGIEFYGKCGFSCNSFIGPFGIRYLCIKEHL